MPGSSVSACHMCHMHSHNRENLVTTSPLRHSRSRAKSSKHSKHHSNAGYSSRDEGSGRIHHAGSSSGLARYSDNSHSLPGSRSSSLSRYHQVSTMPDGSAYIPVARSHSQRSVDLNPPITTILDNRTASLARVSTPLHGHSPVHIQPDILVNATPPRSRTRSRSGSSPRNPVALSQDNSHDYYLDIHRHRFREEKRKHHFNLQTVMLIGCYALLVMIAVVVGIVLCYQNGWLGLGPPKSKIIGEPSNPLNEGSTLTGNSMILNNKSNIKEKVNLSKHNRKINENKHIQHHSLEPSVDGEQIKIAGLLPRNIDNSHKQSVNLNSRHQLPGSTNQRPTQPNRQSPTVNLSHRNQPNHPQHSNSQDRVHNQINPSIGNHQGNSFINKNVNILSNNRQPSPVRNSNQNTNLPNKISFQQNLPNNNQFQPNSNNRESPTRIGNFEANTIAKTLLPGRNNPTQVNTRSNNLSSTFSRGTLPKSDTRAAVLSGRPSFEGFSDATLLDDTSTLTTQELLDLLAIRRMRDLLNAKHNTKHILDLLRHVEPSTKVDLVLEKKQETQIPQLKEELLEKDDVVRISGRNIKSTTKIAPNEFQINKVIDNLKNRQSSNSKNLPDNRDSRRIHTNNRNINSQLEASNSKINTEDADNPEINGAIIRLINRKIKNLKSGHIDPNLNFNVSGVSVFPINSEDLKILLSNNPVVVKDSFQHLSEERLRSLQILKKILDNSENNKVNTKTETGSLISQHLRPPFVPHRLISRMGLPAVDKPVDQELSSSVNTNVRSVNVLQKSEIRNSEKDVTQPVIGIINIATPQARKEKEITPFAVIVKPEGVPRKSLEKINSNRRKTIKEISGLINQENMSKEKIVMVSGPRRDPNKFSSVVRTWTTLDARGTMSSGRVHSDGSFTFTNCRPAEACGSKNNQRTQINNSDKPIS